MVMYKNLIPSPIKYSIIKTSTECGPPEKWAPSQDIMDYLFVRWRLLTLTPKDFAIIEPINPQFYIQLFQKLPLQWAQLLAKFFLDEKNGNIPEKNKQDLAFGLAIMHNQFFGLYKALNPYVESILIKIGSKTLFENLGLEALSLSKRIDPEMLQYFRADLISPEDFKKLWLMPTILKDDKASLLFQSLFQCAEPFPRPSALFSSDNLLTLCNHVIVKKRKQFIDEMVDPCYNILIQEDDYSLCDAYISSFPELKPMMGLMFYESLCANQTTLVDVNEECSKSQCGIQIFDNIIQRFHNDFGLIVILRQITGITVSRSNFAEMSLPFFLRSFLTSSNMEDIMPYRQLEYYIISDNDRLSDFSFIFAQKCISLAIEEIISKEANCQFMQYLSLVMTEEVLQSLLVDLFSLIFLQVNGEYICPPMVAKTIVDAVLSLKDDEQFKIAHRKLDTAISLGMEKIDICFHENRYLLQLLFDEKKYDDAVKIFKYDPELNQIAYLADCADRMRRHLPADFRNINDKNLLSAEFFFTHSEGQPDLEGLDPFVKALVERRLNTANPLECIDADSIPALLTVVEEGQAANLARYPLLNDFIEFQKIAANVNITGHSIIEVINKVVEADDISKFSDFERIAGQMSLELIVRQGDDLGPNFKEMIKNKYPLVYLLLSGSLKIEQGTEVKNTKVLENYVKIPNYSDWTEITESQMHERVIQAFYKEDYDELNDLYYQDSDLYMEEMILLIKKWTLNKIEKVLPFSTYKTMSLVEDKSLTIPETFIKLLRNNRYYAAKELSNEFFIHDIQDLINEHVSGYDQNEIEVIKQYFPDCIINMPPKKPEDDETLMEFIKIVAKQDIKDYNNIIRVIWEFSRRKEVFSVEFVDAVLENATSVISMMLVKDIESELKMIKDFSRLYNSIMQIYNHIETTHEISRFESTFMKLSILNRLLHRHINHRFGFKYNFSNFMSQEFGRFIFTICIIYDYPNLAFDIVNSYQINSNLTYNRAFACFHLGNYQDGLDELKRSIISTNVHSHNVQELLYDLKRSTIFRLPINIDECLKFKHFISIRGTIVQAYASQVGLIASSPQISSLDQSLEITGLKSDRVAFHASTGSFDDAFNAFFDEGFGSNHFISLIFTQALANNNWNMLWRYIMKLKGERPELMTYVNDALTFAKNYHLNYTIFDITFRLGMHDDCLTSGIAKFAQSKSWKEMQRCLEDLKKETQKAIVDEGSKMFKPEKLYELLHRIEIQNQIITVFEDSNKQFSNELELITSREHALTLAANLLLDYHLGFVNEICAFDDVNISDVCISLVNILPLSGRMEEFIKGMRTMNEFDAKMIMPDLIAAFHRRSVTLSSFMQFVNANVPSHDIKALAFAKCGMREEAMNEVRQSKGQNTLIEVNKIFEQYY
ncbi:hypothetical protein TVAG_449200 [Trichomonas vaginalis G3]|uniref:Uncharacterized protein n=1 Tax=Trichomonas vaginalis (strain ATCC PRA-98 / G3) TaxID=412133 RepID=A2FI69_TRIV3|nr:hypothetical protein TVAGG3_0618100 [Trichomonas vaginalis G3]EAX95387.1 hypothetical protein TVAG_449200 [Trichomonas vaginalis G3]KAI5503703.1 hypothetical protein TVAGG3_0618100 [Trichomonas vaginalis G3]|eukprot:XP_001308317.1 hypothetical protein [Trichomonas vaginalis G3]